MFNNIHRVPEILIVDDAPEQIHFVASILSEEKYKVRVLTDSSEVFESLNISKPDLILLDIMMPGINGIELCKSLKSNPAFSSIPVIFLTSVSNTNTIIDAFSAGAQDYVSKPVNPKELVARVGVHLQLKYKTESLEEAYKEIESFNHIVSHDLKSPLWAIKNLVEFLNDEYMNSDESEAKRLLHGLGEKASDAIQLIGKLSELSKVSSDPIMKEKIKLADLFVEVYNVLLTENPERHIEFYLSDLPEVMVDKLLIKQVIYNVLSNSFKYTRHRETSAIKVIYQKKEYEHEFCIEDNGAGFNMNYAGKLFSMFQRLHSNKEFEGTGTGLAITKKIIQRHYGRVWIESEEQKGTKFYFTLPF